MAAAIAQVEQGFDEETESGGFSTENEGNNSNVCAPDLQFGNTGNLQNEQGVVQYASKGEPGFGGASVSFGPSLEMACDQVVQQSSAASSN